MEQTRKNPLGREKIGALLARFAVPSIITMLVSALYNIVDQFFIGWSVGVLGNAAPQCRFPTDHHMHRSVAAVRHRRRDVCRACRGFYCCGVGRPVCNPGICTDEEGGGSP